MYVLLVYNSISIGTLTTLKPGIELRVWLQVLQDDDARLRLVVAKFILARLAAHRKDDFDGALQSLMAMAQSSSNGGLIDNPFLQLHAFLSHDLLSLDDL